MWAIKANKPANVECLLSLRADYHLVNYKGQSTLDLAMKHSLLSCELLVKHSAYEEK